MNAKTVLICLFVSLATGFGVGLLATELLQHEIEFSLFVGIPAGVAAAVAVMVASLLFFGKRGKVAPETINELR
ncbi:MAG: hypothetical protein CVT48_00930 [Thermoplasmata archaeon HGW-Thermoplasmata-1]|nr:MAG: hypothetical protein CVT48_00930 [Thermoplasmata archaeon HGW-Thermoplasmata-1]